VIIGQAPGSAVHKTGIPWDDKSGQRLRDWLGISPEVFYDSAAIALIPMGLCYPGTGKTDQAIFLVGSVVFNND
jgi:uracil-DNA glycosylase